MFQFACGFFTAGAMTSYIDGRPEAQAVALAGLVISAGMLLMQTKKTTQRTTVG